MNLLSASREPLRSRTLLLACLVMTLTMLCYSAYGCGLKDAPLLCSTSALKS